MEDRLTPDVVHRIRWTHDVPVMRVWLDVWQVSAPVTKEDVIENIRGWFDLLDDGGDDGTG